MSQPSWQKELTARLNKAEGKPLRIAIVGVGNRDNGDDAAGILALEALANALPLKTAEWLLLLDGGIAPENLTAPLRRFSPELVIFLDAADFGGQSGEVRWIGAEEIDGFSASTHSLPLGILAVYLSVDTGCQCAVIGIQGMDWSPGGALDQTVASAAREVGVELAGLLSA